MRCDYLMATFNPDDPNLDIYKEYINCSRPLPEWEEETPKEIKDELREEPKPGWVHWFFSFKDNAGLPKEKLDKIIQNTPKGTKIWKNKIEGLRGKATGLIFPNFDRKKHVVSAERVRQQVKSGKMKFKKFTAGLDTSYSSKSPDTIAMTFQGITEDRRLITLEEKVYNNAKLEVPLAPSDTAVKFIAFLEQCRKDWGFARDVFIDNADQEEKVYNNAKLEVPLAPSDTAVKFIAFLEQCRKDWGFARDVFIDNADQATITELNKYKRLKGCLYSFYDSYKKVTILDRINLQIGWIQQECYLVVDTCTEHLAELDSYSWKEDKDEPEDGHDHTINSQQYAWIPYRHLIGFEEEKK